MNEFADGAVAYCHEMLATTRSVRRRIDFERPVERKLILECIEVAIQAPTGVGAETWRFVVLTDPGKKTAIAELYRRAFDDYMEIRAEDSHESGQTCEPLSPNYRFLADRLEDFPALILVCREGRPPETPSHQLAFYGSILPAAWSLMVAMRARSLGSTWTTLLSSYEAETATVLDMPADSMATVLLPVGYLKDAVLRRANRRPAHEVTYWNGWGAPSD